MGLETQSAEPARSGSQGLSLVGTVYLGTRGQGQRKVSDRGWGSLDPSSMRGQLLSVLRIPTPRLVLSCWMPWTSQPIGTLICLAALLKSLAWGLHVPVLSHRHLGSWSSGHGPLALFSGSDSSWAPLVSTFLILVYLVPLGEKFQLQISLPSPASLETHLRAEYAPASPGVGKDSNKEIFSL